MYINMYIYLYGFVLASVGLSHKIAKVIFKGLSSEQLGYA